MSDFPRPFDRAAVDEHKRRMIAELDAAVTELVEAVEATAHGWDA